MRKKWLIHIALVLISPGVFLQAQSNDQSHTQKNADAPTITITKLDVNETILELSYEIRNDSQQEVWFCDEIGFNSGFDSEICLSEDNQLLTIRRRLDVPASGIVWYVRPSGKYIRLLPGKKRYESLSISIPINGNYIFEPRKYRRYPDILFYVSRLAIEIGYYEGNLPEMIFNMLKEAENNYKSNIEAKPEIMKIFGGALSFNYFREQFRNRDEEILIPYTYQRLKGEKVLHTVINELRIPCKKRQGPTIQERQGGSRADFAPDLKTCTRLEIRYEPSAIEYFFPYTINQNLLSHAEIEYLQSGQVFVIEDQNVIKSFAKKIMDSWPGFRIIRENNIAYFDCYHNNDHLTSFTIYENKVIETEEKKRLCLPKNFLGTEVLTPEIQKLKYRVQCAINLRDLYYRLRLYNLIVAKQKKESIVKDVVIYPTTNDWIDALISAGRLPMSVIMEFLIAKSKKTHVCPSVGKGKSTYAMNPNCQPNSSGDMVLLFETKAGWNQHGGEELFTFDNHNPRGGCVLLNDGSVKFIRTEEELNALKWK